MITQRALSMTFRVSDTFIYNGFQGRLLPFLAKSRAERTWHIIGAVPGSGKTYGIGEVVRGSGMAKGKFGTTHMPILSFRSPKNARSENALGIAMTAAFGVVPNMPWDLRRTWLASEAARVGVELIIADDAQDLSLDQLTYLRELTDNLEAPPYNRKVGLCLICASENNTIPLVDTFKIRNELKWRQFKRRLDAEAPSVMVSNHNVREVREICKVYEAIYRDQLPGLHLQQWAKAIHGYLTTPILDPEGSGEATMHNIHRFLMYCLRTTFELEKSDVEASLLIAASELMNLDFESVTQLKGAEDAEV